MNVEQLRKSKVVVSEKSNFLLVSKKGKEFSRTRPKEYNAELHPKISRIRLGKRKREPSDVNKGGFAQIPNFEKVEKPSVVRESKMKWRAKTTKELEALEEKLLKRFKDALLRFNPRGDHSVKQLELFLQWLGSTASAQLIHKRYSNPYSSSTSSTDDSSTDAKPK